jgi:protocatechuate 3,4-dioxygenase beta subunit
MNSTAKGFRKLGLLLLAGVAVLGVALWLVMQTPANSERSPSTSAQATPEVPPSFSTDTMAREPAPLVKPVSTVPVETHAEPPVTTAAQAPSGTAAAAADVRRLTVTVMSAEGRPVPGASVQAWFNLSDFAVQRALDAPDPLAVARSLAGEDLPGNFAMRRADPTWLPPFAAWTTDGAGTIEIRLPASSVLLVAEQEDRASSGVVALPDADSPDARDAATLKLYARGSIHGRVLEMDGQPAVGASVSFSKVDLPGGDGHRGRLPRPLQADEQGRFALDVDGDFYLKAAASRDLARTADQGTRVPAGGTIDLELRFPGGFGVGGLVRGPDGSPLPDAQVWASGKGIYTDKVQTDDDGRFRIVLAQPCHVTVLARAEGVAQEQCVAATVNDAQPQAEVELRLGATTHISGRVTWEDGTPLTEGILTASPARPHFATPEESSGWLMNDDQHRYDNALEAEDFLRGSNEFRIDGLLAGRNYRITLFSQERIIGRPALEDVAPGTEDAVLVVRHVQPGTDVLRGHVVDAVTHAAVSPCDLSAYPWKFGGLTMSSLVDPSTAASDGAFRFEKLDPETEYGLRVEAANYPPQNFGPFKPSADADVLVAVGRHATLDIQVVDEQGQPVAASVQMTQPSPHPFGGINDKVESRATDPGGHLAWPDLSPGTFALEAAAGSSRAAPLLIQVLGGQSTSVQLVLHASAGTGRLAIQVRHADGSAWGGTQIRAMRYGPEASDVREAVYLGTAGNDGTLLLEALPAGHYMLRADASGVFVASGHALVADGQTASAEVKPVAPN